MSRLVPFLLVLVAVRESISQDAPAVPPVAKKVPHALTLHGDTRSDDYFWLKDKSNPEVIKHLEAENAYTKAATARLEPLRKQLYREMIGRIRQTDRTVPARDNGYWYYSRTEEGRQYPTYCRKKGTLETHEEFVLDANAAAKGKKFLDVGEQKVSDDGNLLAFTLDFTGFREYELSVKDLRTADLEAVARRMHREGTVVQVVPVARPEPRSPPFEGGSGPSSPAQPARGSCLTLLDRPVLVVLGLLRPRPLHRYPARRNRS